jgi:hypothetical protein
MTLDLTTVRIYIRLGVTDTRKAVNGLTILIQEKMEMTLLAGACMCSTAGTGSCCRRYGGTRWVSL